MTDFYIVEQLHVIRCWGPLVPRRIFDEVAEEKGSCVYTPCLPVSNVINLRGRLPDSELGTLRLFRRRRGLYDAYTVCV